jgi:hypothetical protein
MRHLNTVDTPAETRTGTVQNIIRKRCRLSQLSRWVLRTSGTGSDRKLEKCIMRSFTICTHTKHYQRDRLKGDEMGGTSIDARKA